MRDKVVFEEAVEQTRAPPRCGASDDLGEPLGRLQLPQPRFASWSTSKNGSLGSSGGGSSLTRCGGRIQRRDVGPRSKIPAAARQLPRRAASRITATSTGSARSRCSSSESSGAGSGAASWRRATRPSESQDVSVRRETPARWAQPLPPILLAARARSRRGVRPSAGPAAHEASVRILRAACRRLFSAATVSAGDHALGRGGSPHSAEGRIRRPVLSRGFRSVVVAELNVFDLDHERRAVHPAQRVVAVHADELGAAAIGAHPFFGPVPIVNPGDRQVQVLAAESRSGASSSLGIVPRSTRVPSTSMSDSQSGCHSANWQPTHRLACVPLPAVGASAVFPARRIMPLLPQRERRTRLGWPSIVSFLRLHDNEGEAHPARPGRSRPEPYRAQRPCEDAPV
jgi:hypothetical protein